MRYWDFLLEYRLHYIPASSGIGRSTIRMEDAMARALSEFRRNIRDLAVDLLRSEPTVETTESTPAGLIKYVQLTSLSHLPDTMTIRDLVVRTVNAELRAAAIEAAMSIDRRINDLVSLAKAAGVSPEALIRRLGK